MGQSLLPVFHLALVCNKRVNPRTKELWEMRQKLSNCNNINGLWHKFWNCKRMVRWMKAGVREDLSWRHKGIAHKNEMQDLGLQCLYFAVNTLCLSFSVWLLSIFLPLYINPFSQNIPLTSLIHGTSKIIKLDFKFALCASGTLCIHTHLWVCM